MVSLDQFKTAFAGKVSPDPVQERDKVVAQSLKRLKGILANEKEANGNSDGFNAALKKLVERYDTARKQVGGNGKDAAQEFDKILDQAGHVMDSWLKLPKAGSPGDPKAAPPPPDAGKGVADQKNTAPPDATGGAADHTSKTLKKGATGPAVSFLQEQLNDEGADLDVDGDFGALTQKAVIRFQSRAGVDEKGIVGPLTWKALNGAGADGIDIDATVTLAQQLHAEFEQAKDPAQKGQVARKLLAIAASLERRLGRAVKDGNGKPKLSGKVQWDAAAKGVIADLAPFAAREQWVAANSAAPPAKAKSNKAPSAKSIKEEMQGWELKDGSAPLVIEVTDSKNGRPIPGATVKFNGGGDETTGDDGRVRVNIEASSNWKIEISSPGYITNEDTFEAKDKEPVLRKTRLVRKESLSGVPMEFTVVNELDGSKVKQAKITVGKLSQVTDADGFAGMVLPPGSPQATVTAKGYYQYEERITVPELDLYNKNPGVKKVFKIKPQTPLADELQGWELQDGTAPLVVEVLDSKSGKPVVGAEVLFDTGEKHRVNSDGRLRVNQAAPGAVKIEVLMPGYQSATDSFKVEEKKGVFRTVRLVAKDRATLSPSALEITLVDETDTTKTVVGAQMTVGRISHVSGQGGIVNLVLPPGVQSYTITKKGYHKKEGALRVPEFDVTGTGAATPVEIKLKPQTALADEMRNMGLKDGKAPIVVEVLDAKTGKPIMGASIRFEDGEVFATDKDGRDRYHLRVGKTWKLEVTASGYQKGQDSFETKEKSGQMRTIKLVPVNAGNTGRVVVDIVARDVTTAKRLANAKVTLGRESGVTNEGGKFQVRVLPGVHAYSIVAKGYEKAAGRLDVAEGKDVNLQVIDLNPSGTGDIFVRVRSSGSKLPIEKAVVSLARQMFLSDGKGEARLRSIPFGNHELHVDADDHKEKRSLVLHNGTSTTVGTRELAKGEFIVIDLEPK